MSVRWYSLAAALSLAAAPTALAQMATPGPEHKQLAFFAGEWTSKGEMKPGPMGPGGAMTATSSCEWFEGGFHLVCRTDGSGPFGEMHGLGILGYSAERKRYTYYGIDNSGMGDPAFGQLVGDTWSWEGDMLMGGQAMKSYYTLKQLSPDSYSWKWEMSVAGGQRMLVAEGTDTRSK